MSKNPTLYHYTNIAGLNSIIQSGKVWASDCRYLNDQQELARALKMFLEKYKGIQHEVLSCAFHWHNFSRCHCVFSLSRSPQVLSQWRAYADDGKGAAIGFHCERIFRKGTFGAAISLVDCVYKDHVGFIDNLRSRCQHEVEELIRMHQEVGGAVNAFWEAIDKNPNPLQTLYSELLSIKNHAFAEEQEVRLIINVSSKQVQTRVNRGLIIPYVEHAFVEKEDLNSLWCVAPEVWLGPKCDERNMHAIAVFQQYGWQINNGLYRFNCGYV